MRVDARLGEDYLVKPDSVELTTEQEFILRRMVKLAKQIRQNGQLKRILRKIDPDEREAFYNLLKPHLSFKPHPYSVISKWLA